jgi:small subunit ribosomal protein S17
MSDKATTQTTRSAAIRRTLVGTVVSRSMKTINVLNERREQHPKYKKYIRRFTKLLAHDEKNEANIGDKVQVMECRPISKQKSWRLVKVLEKAKSLENLAEETPSSN